MSSWRRVVAEEPSNLLYSGVGFGLGLYFRPQSHFFEFGVGSDGRWDETSGSTCAGAIPADDVMRAALILFTGGQRADVFWEAQPGAVCVSFIPHRDERPFARAITRAQLVDTAVRIDRNACDEATWALIEDEDNRTLGWAPSILQLAFAAKAMGETYYEGRDASPALIALRGALWALDALEGTEFLEG